MPKRDRASERLAELERILADPDGVESQKRLGQTLGQKNNLVVARSAEIAAELGRTDLTAALEAAFLRFRQADWEADKGARAKEALVKALDALETRSHEVFLAALRCVQKEPAWGPPVDTAVGVRSAAAVALVNAGYPDVVRELSVLLADPEWAVRANAARALGATGRPDAAPLLRYKAMIGDPETQVTTEVIASLLDIDAEDALDIVKTLLASEDGDARACAALALGQSRLSAAVSLLTKFSEETLIAQRDLEVAFVALAMIRSPEAWEFLLATVKNGREPRADAALEALGAYTHDTPLMERLREAVGESGELRLKERFEALVGAD